MDTTTKYDNPSPQLQANPISKLFFFWLLPIFKYGYGHNLELKDVYNTTKSDSSADLADELERHWLNEVRGAKQEEPSLMRALRKTFWKSFAVVGFFSLLRSTVYTFYMPIVLAEFISSFSRISSDSTRAWYLGGAVILLTTINCIIAHHTGLYGNVIGMRARIACSSLIYRKLLKLDKLSLQDTDVGKLVNLLSNDMSRFDRAGILTSILIMPVQATVGAFIMYSYVGIAAFVGIGTMVIQAIPIQGTFSKLQGKLRFKIATRTDQRIKLMNEITSGIQVIKMYAWEKPFEKIVAQLRKYEINQITKTFYIRGLSSAISVFCERFALYVTVVTYVLLGNHLTGSVVFSMMQVINTLQSYMCIQFPRALSTYAETKTSIRRIEEFLMKSEREEDDDKQIRRMTADPGMVKFQNVYASWTPNPIVDTLIDISFELKPGSFCCIVGNVGSGKSSILHMMLKELSLSSGKMQINGKVSFASQEPWLFVSNVRNNILFGQPYHKNKYDRVIEVCALKRDLKLFPFGDKTNVGEKGVSLSGGQRARINLARAVYRDADIYLLDDPLSAVDPHVAKQLVEKCILEHLSNKTRILVTHQTQFLNRADFVLILNNGKVEKFINPMSLSSNELQRIRQISVSETSAPQIPLQMQSLISLKSLGLGDPDDLDDEPQETKELIQRGSMPFSVYKDYYRAGGSALLLTFEVLLLFISQAICNGCDLWVTFWTNNVAKQDIQAALEVSKTVSSNLTTQSFETLTTLSDSLLNATTLDLETTTADFQNISSVTMETIGVTDPSILDALHNSFIGNEITVWSTSMYIQVYTLLIILAIILTTGRTTLFYKISMRASENLHNRMFTNVLRAPMRFFDLNPSGRILNRFSKDMGAIDEQLPISVMLALQVFLVAAGILIMNFIKAHWLIPPTVALAAVLCWFRNVFMKTAQDVKRLEATAKAPIFTYVAASLDGLRTIRSANAEDMVTREFDEIQDQHTSTWSLFINSFEAFGFYLDMVSILLLLVETVQFLVFSTALEGDVGLVISQTLIIIGMLQIGIRSTADVSSNMVSVERILEYTKLDREHPFESLPTNKPPRDWPEAGRITFKNVYLRYVIDEDPVLKNLNISIEPSEKIGIVGRTGAGKSTLIAALFRLAPTDGSIQIDGVEIANVGLTELRTKISIIPQEPILFSESIRYNLDPFGKSDDKVLWDALENVELKNAVESLDMKVSEGGSNFSTGQKQLICLARAIVRNNRVLVMDEATANVDPQTDALIQNTIRRNFKDCTVLTVAHRINTIIDSDRVIVMDAGHMKEFAPPHELLQNSESFFSKMVAETGREMEARLRKAAEEHYLAKKYD